MDLLCYMMGLDSGTPGATPLEIFTHFPRYTVEQVSISFGKLISDGAVDSLLVECLVETDMWLMDSLDSSLESDLDAVAHTGVYGPVLWMHIVQEVRMKSFWNIRLLEEKINK